MVFTLICCVYAVVIFKGIAQCILAQPLGVLLAHLMTKCMINFVISPYDDPAATPMTPNPIGASCDIR
ncbi:MAG TPA: hypothetical protein DHV03_00330 [Alphaproteobacteria bacterium]|nr:hypothetical protein [Alphaproteobacteria bacterium]